MILVVINGIENDMEECLKVLRDATAYNGIISFHF